MTDDEHELVTRAEMNGLWLQSDAARNGLQGLEHANRVLGYKIDDIKATVGVIRALVIMPSVIATFVLLRVLWILRGTIFEDAQALLSMVAP